MSTTATNEWADALQNRVLAGKYRLLRVLDRGGMGAVFEAEQPALGRRVAIKLVLPHRQADERTMQRFVTEARAAARVADGGVPQVFDFDYDAELGPFQVLELLEGESLQARLRRGPLSLSSAYAVVLETLAVLARVHAAGVVHRDIKPANVFLEQRPDGTRRVRVLDFGVARVRDPNRPRVTQTGAMLGTLGYMAPEALAGRDTDHRADLYSAAVLLWSCLTGQEPFAGMNAIGIIAAVNAGQVPSLRAARPDLSERLQRVYEWATAADPNQRPASAAALATELHRAQLDEAPGSASASAPPTGHAAHAFATPPPPAAHAASTMVSGVSAPPPSTPASPAAAGAFATHTPRPSSSPSVHAPGASTPQLHPLGASVSRDPPPAAPARRHGWVMPVALAVALGALGATATILVWVLNSASSDRGNGSSSPQSPAPQGNNPPLPVPRPDPNAAPDPTLDAARADLASARALDAQQRSDEAIALVERARRALMSPPPAAGTARVATLAEAQIALGDLYRARMVAQAARVSGSGALASVRCWEATQDSVTAASGAYNALVVDARFLDQRQCGEQRMGLLYESVNAACGRVRDSSLSYVRTAVQYYRQADRPGECQAEASAGLARVLPLEASLSR